MSKQAGSCEAVVCPRSVESVQEVVEALLVLAPAVQSAPCVVLVGGCSRTGKTWLASQLCNSIEASGLMAVRVSLDAWLLGVEQRPAVSTVLQRFECSAIVRAVTELMQGQMVYPPVYDPVSRRRVAPRTQRPLQVSKGFVLLDGVIALALPELRAVSRLNIYVNVPDTIRLERLRAFYADVKGLGPEADTIITERETEEVPFIMQTKQWADLIFEARSQLWL